MTQILKGKSGQGWFYKNVSCLTEREREREKEREREREKEREKKREKEREREGERERSFTMFENTAYRLQQKNLLGDEISTSHSKHLSLSLSLFLHLSSQTKQ
jgi:hypothetical protein